MSTSMNGWNNVQKAIYNTLEQATKNPDNVLKKVGSFRGARVQVNVNGETFKISLRRLEKIATFLQGQEGISETQRGTINDGMEILKNRAKLNPSNRQKIQSKVKNLFHSFKKTISGAAESAADTIKSSPRTIGDKINSTIDKLQTQRVLRSLIAETGKGHGINDKNPEKARAGLKELVNHLVFNKAGTQTQLNQMKTVLEYRMSKGEPGLDELLKLVKTKITVLTQQEATQKMLNMRSQKDEEGNLRLQNDADLQDIMTKAKIFQSLGNNSYDNLIETIENELTKRAAE